MCSIACFANAGDALALYSWSDVTYVLFPILIIWRMSLPTHRKIGLIILMGLSLFTTVASILKAIITLSEDNSGDGGSVFYSNDGSLWCSIEQSFLIIIGCIPVLVPLSKLDHPIINWLNAALDRMLNKSFPSASQQRPPYANSKFEAGVGYPDPAAELKTIGRMSVRRPNRRRERDEMALTMDSETDMHRIDSSRSDDCESGSKTREADTGLAEQYVVTYTDGTKGMS